LPGKLTTSDIRTVNSDGRMNNCGYNCLAAQSKLTLNEYLTKHNLHREYQANPLLSDDRMLQLARLDYPHAQKIVGPRQNVANWLDSELQPGQTKKYALGYQHPGGQMGHFQSLKTFKDNVPGAPLQARHNDFQQAPNSPHRYPNQLPKQIHQDQLYVIDYKPNTHYTPYQG